jgi:uncharacterized protein with NRDE domain
LFRVLEDTRPPPDDTLPQTGVSLEWERLLATAFISTAGYGTRASTVVLVQHSGEVTFVERNFAPGGTLTETRSIELRPDASVRLATANPS